jgi:hypothetical protein
LRDDRGSADGDPALLDGLDKLDGAIAQYGRV